MTDTHPRGTSSEQSPPIEHTATPDSTGVSPASGTGLPTPPLAPSSATSAHSELNRIRGEMPDILRMSQMHVAQGTLPLIGWGFQFPKVQRIIDANHEAHRGKPWYFIGDIHGDFLAWHHLMQRVRQDPEFRVCFIGDLVDRGTFSVECFAAVLEVVLDHPDRMLWIVGNHDNAIQYVPEQRAFRSTVDPAEFVDWLNDQSDAESQHKRVEWGKLFIDVCERLPRAMLLPGGLLATHGGIPLGDRWENLKTIEAFLHPRVLDDFTWTRAATMPRRKGYIHKPAERERSSSFDYGYQDLADFCDAVQTVLPVRRIIRGHDHILDGWEQPKQYADGSLITINGFGFDYLTNSPLKYRETLSLGYLPPNEGATVERVMVPVSATDREAIYPKPTPTGDAEPAGIASDAPATSSVATPEDPAPSPPHPLVPAPVPTSGHPSAEPAPPGA